MKRRKPKYRVLLVEDDELNLELLQTVLEGAAFVVLPASAAPAGIELARREQPDAILMDVQMPEMDGLEATRALRADPTTCRIPVIAVTAHVKPEDRARCLQAGCALYLPKPVDTRALPEQVEQVIIAAGGRPARRAPAGIGRQRAYATPPALPAGTAPAHDPSVAKLEPTEVAPTLEAVPGTAVPEAPMGPAEFAAQPGTVEFESPPDPVGLESPSDPVAFESPPGAPKRESSPGAAEQGAE
jgi:two-component system, cell cycle response regulator DivK